MMEAIPGILGPDAVARIVSVMGRAGFADGKASAGYRAGRVKNNEQMEEGDDSRREIDLLVIDGLRNNGLFQRVVLPRIIIPPLFSRYRPGMEYGLHVDAPVMGGNTVRTDVSVTVFLSEPRDYDGGELEIRTSYGMQRVKLPAGAAVVYPSSTMHRVMPVTRGERLAAVTWVQSLVRDPVRRELLYDLDRVSRRMAQVDADSPEADLAFGIHANLTRLWMD